jgi:hypothetical protein
VVFDEVLSHDLLGYFLLLSTDVLQIISLYLSPPHSHDDSPSTSVSGRTLSRVASQMDTDREILFDSPRVSSSIMITPPNDPTVLQLNNVEDIPSSTLGRPRHMPKWALSTLLDSTSFLPKGDLGPR